MTQVLRSNCDQMTRVLKTWLFAMFSPETQLSSFFLSSTGSFSLLRSEGVSVRRYNIDRIYRSGLDRLG